MYVRIHVHSDDVILAACDEDILGMTFRGDGMKITVTESFYKGESLEREAFVERMKSVSVMNLVGNEVVRIVSEEGYVSPGSIVEIGGVKHAQVVMM
ncbi:MAG: DUF424 family protein [Candidatus Methanomethylophilaceae archaeon]|nr:DUF424 family protein [Candidatus Methanomethylophilaceae archaeon]